MPSAPSSTSGVQDGYPTGTHPFDLVLCECTHAGSPGRYIAPGHNKPCAGCQGMGPAGYQLRGDRHGTLYGLTLDFRAAQRVQCPEPLR